MGVFDIFGSKEDRKTEMRKEFEKLATKLELEEQAVANIKTIMTDVSFKEIKIGDTVTISGATYEVGDIISYANEITGPKFQKYELVGDKCSIWLKEEGDSLYKYNYIANFPEDSTEVLIYNNDSYTFFEGGSFHKNSIRKYDDIENSLDKTCEYSMYKNSRNEVILLEETDEFKDTSIGSLILENEIKIQRGIKQ